MIKIENLTFGYKKDSPAIKNLNLTIEKGKFVCLLGNNGSGKSTLAKLIAGLLKIKEGSIKVNDIEVKEENYSDVRKLCYLVFQNPDNQFVGATVEDDIAFGLENHNCPHEQMRGLVDEYAAKVGMLDYLKREPGYLSGGQKQRVAIAGALVVKPKILIFDEATSMLDPKGRTDILNLIEQMKKEDKDLTVLFITHDVNEAINADEVVVLNKGEIKFQGKPETLFSNHELCHACDLNRPFGFKLKSLLQERGLSLKSTSYEGLLEELCQ